VQVNGEDATTTDGFATWRAVVPLTMGEANALTVATVDGAGFTDPAAAVVTVNVMADVSGERFEYFGDGYAVALDGNRAFVVDFDNDQLVEVNIDTGVKVIISDATKGGGPDLFGPNGIALINGGIDALVTNFVPDELLLVAVGGGDRTIVSHANPNDDPKISPNVGAGPTLFGPSGIGLVDGARVLVSNYAADEIMDVNLVNGDRTILSADRSPDECLDCGSGPAFLQPDGIVMESTNRAIVTDALVGAVFAVNLTTGDRTIVSGSSTGNGPLFVRPVGIILDNADNRALVADYDANLLLSVDMTSGNRTIFSDANSNVGTGPAFIFPAGIALDAANNRAVVSGGNLVVVELGSGDRVIVGR
jgi:hypothetical protein